MEKHLEEVVFELKRIANELEKIHNHMAKSAEVDPNLDAEIDAEEKKEAAEIE